MARNRPRPPYDIHQHFLFLFHEGIKKKLPQLWKGIFCRKRFGQWTLTTLKEIEGGHYADDQNTENDGCGQNTATVPTYFAIFCWIMAFLGVLAFYSFPPFSRKKKEEIHSMPEKIRRNRLTIDTDNKNDQKNKTCPIPLCCFEYVLLPMVLQYKNRR